MTGSEKRRFRRMCLVLFFILGIILFAFVIDAAQVPSCPTIPLVVNDAREEAWALRMWEKLAERGVPVRIELTPDYGSVLSRRQVLHPVPVQPLPVQPVPLAFADVFDANRALFTRAMGDRATQNPYIQQGLQGLSKKLICAPVPK